MKYRSSIKSFFRQLPVGKMTGHQKFLALAAWECAGKPGWGLEIARIKKDWRKSILKSDFNPSFYDRADRDEWVKPTGKRGWFAVTVKGIEHLEALVDGNGDQQEIKGCWGLRIFHWGQSVTFDTHIRNILAKAKKYVFFADSYTDENTFDNALAIIPRTLKIYFLLNHTSGKFLARDNRFKIEYKKYFRRRHPRLHDRFFVVDDVAYIVGTSINNATKKSPTMVITADRNASRLIRDFFQYLWAQAK
ncbi:MAG: hypothetical protein PHI63_03380 [Patescibacteria group bacterium]|nr:hypothetical protein [Patescibacteria group bacterium]